MLSVSSVPPMTALACPLNRSIDESPATTTAMRRKLCTSFTSSTRGSEILAPSTYGAPSRDGKCAASTLEVRGTFGFVSTSELDPTDLIDIDHLLSDEE